MSRLRKLFAGVGRDLVLNTAAASPLVPTRLRWLALRAVGMPVERAGIAPHVWFGSREVRIGRDTYVGPGCLFDTWAPITIGARCAIAMQVTFATSSHRMGGPHRRAGALTAAPIVVGDGAWIGARSTILPGVTVGEGAVVAAGAVVVADCAPHTLYAGVPARPLRSLGSADDEAWRDRLRAGQLPDATQPPDAGRYRGVPRQATRDDRERTDAA